MPLDSLHPDFIATQKLIYNAYGWECADIQKEAESKEYGACSFTLNNCRIMFRVGKITPTKIGQFVTLWKRVAQSPIIPYDMADSIDVFVIAVRHNNRLGHFVFPKSVLNTHGVVSHNGKGGKRALRLYPAWDLADNLQAKRTQAWQLNYFFEINPAHPIDKRIIEKLFV